MTSSKKNPSIASSAAHLGTTALAVLALLFATGCQSQADREAEARGVAYRAKRDASVAVFKERCKTAGLVVKRRVEDVEGIRLPKIRPELSFADDRYFDPMFPGAAMAGEAQGNDYIKQFLKSEFRNASMPERRGMFGRPDRQPGHGELPAKRGYQFVEVFDPGEARWYRITLPSDPTQSEAIGPDRVPIDKPTARYALDFEDLVDPADRAHWIAGTKLKVIDQQTGEVIAELTSFVIELGFGNRATGRWPWVYAATQGGDYMCPERDYSTNIGNSDIQTRIFVDAVLIPKQGD